MMTPSSDVIRHVFDKSIIYEITFLISSIFQAQKEAVKYETAKQSSLKRKREKKLSFISHPNESLIAKKFSCVTAHTSHHHMATHAHHS